MNACGISEPRSNGRVSLSSSNVSFSGSVCSGTYFKSHLSSSYLSIGDGGISGDPIPQIISSSEETVHIDSLNFAFVGFNFINRANLEIGDMLSTPLVDNYGRLSFVKDTNLQLVYFFFVLFCLMHDY